MTEMELSENLVPKEKPLTSPSPPPNGVNIPELRQPLPPPPGFVEVKPSTEIPMPYNHPLKVQLTPKSVSSMPPIQTPDNNNNNNNNNSSSSSNINNSTTEGLLAPAQPITTMATQRLASDAMPAMSPMTSRTSASNSVQPEFVEQQPPPNQQTSTAWPDVTYMAYEILCKTEQMRWNFQVALLLLIFIVAMVFLLALHQSSGSPMMVHFTPPLTSQHQPVPTCGSQNCCSMQQSQ